MSRSATAQLLVELQKKLSSANVVERLETLRRVTDIFQQADRQYSHEQLELFDELFHQLIAEIENDAKAALAKQLCDDAQAPRRLMRTLAFDDDIRIAGPVLTRSPQLDDQTLAENARTKSQLHLLAIAARKLLSLCITDVLLQRGNEIVITRLAGNAGAELSEAGYATITERASTSAAIASSLIRCRKMPRHHYAALVARASAEVRARLNASYPGWSDTIEATVASVAERVKASHGPDATDDTLTASLAHSLHMDGRLDEAQIGQFIATGAIHEAVFALACLARVQVSTTHTLLTQSGAEGYFVLAKTAGLHWDTVVTLAAAYAAHYGVQTPKRFTTEDRDVYKLLRESTALQVLRYYRLENVINLTPSE